MNPVAWHEIAAVIVDLDGTMVDTVGDFEAALRLTLAELGLPAVARAFIERSVGKGSEHLVQQSLREAGGAPDRLDEALAAYHRHYPAINGRHSAVYGGVVEGLQALRALGLPLVCLTNKPGDAARELLRIKSLDGFFTQVYGGDAFERKKPDPLPLLRCCAALGLPPAQVLMVGDSSNDAAAARAAGCPVALLRHGYNHGQPVDAVDADLHLDALDQLPPRLRPQGCRAPM